MLKSNQKVVKSISSSKFKLMHSENMDTAKMMAMKDESVAKLEKKLKARFESTSPDRPKYNKNIPQNLKNEMSVNQALENEYYTLLKSKVGTDLSMI